MSVTVIMLIAIAILILVIVSGPPIPLAFAGAIIWLVFALEVDSRILFTTAYGNVKAFILVALPLFILAGGVMAGGHIGDVLVRWIECFTGRIRGGLIVASVCASGLFGSVCGSGTATLTCIGSILAPKLEERNYPRGLYAAVLCCAAPLGLLIPPSGIQILFAWATGVSVLGCFLAIVIPGIMLIITISIVSWVLVRKAPNLPEATKQSPIEWGKGFGITTGKAVPALLMPVIILGGIYGGILTPTEAAGVSVIYAIPIAMFYYKKMSGKQLIKTMRDSSVTAGVMIMLVAFATVLSRLFTQEGLPTMILNLLTSISDNPIIILLMINLFMVILGMITDDCCGTLIAGPLLLPVVVSLGISPYHFAAILGVNLGMGNITPPCAPFLYLASRICKVPVAEMLKYVFIIIVFAYVPVLMLVSYIPELSLWLPKLVMGGKLSLYL